MVRAPRPRDTVLVHAGFDAFIVEMFDIGEAIRAAGFDVVLSHGGPLLSAAARALLATRPTRAVLDSAVRRLMERDLNAEWGVQQAMHVTGTNSPSAFLEATNPSAPRWGLPNSDHGAQWRKLHRGHQLAKRCLFQHPATVSSHRSSHSSRE